MGERKICRRRRAKWWTKRYELVLFLYFLKFEHCWDDSHNQPILTTVCPMFTTTTCSFTGVGDISFRRYYRGRRFSARCNEVTLWRAKPDVYKEFIFSTPNLLSYDKFNYLLNFITLQFSGYNKKKLRNKNLMELKIKNFFNTHAQLYSEIFFEIDTISRYLRAPCKSVSPPPPRPLAASGYCCSRDK